MSVLLAVPASEKGDMIPIDLASPTLGAEVMPKAISLQVEKLVDLVAEVVETALLHVVQSSNMLAVGFNSTSPGKGDLYVLFRNGGLYRYPDVSVARAATLLCAPSVGSAFAKLIKAAGYEANKIT